jgi:hypothetical protein
MPSIGIQVDDHRATWAELREALASGDVARFRPSSPAILAYLLSLQHERADVKLDEVSASQYEKGIRQLLLEATTDYYVDPSGELASTMGTKAHAIINQEFDPNFVVETRLVFEEGGVRYGSAKCDTLYVPLGELEDLKTIKWYSIEMMLKEGVVKAKPGYVYQLNLFRVLMKDPANQERILDRYPQFTREQLIVNKMVLQCVPPDLNTVNRKSAEKLVEDPRQVPILVPFLDDDSVLDAYRKKYYEKQDALQRNWAPLCSPDERWQKDFGYPLKCAKFCSVADACRAMSAKAGERHPLDEWEIIKARKAAKAEVEKARASKKPASPRQKASAA